METKKTTYKSKAGFALLITIIVVGVVLSVGLAILDLSIKQVRLSTNTKDSEISLHAANAGAECAKYWRRKLSDDMLVGDDISVSCFGVGSVVVSGDKIAEDLGNGEAFLYNYQFTWGGVPRCTEITTLVASSTIGGSGLTINGMGTLVPGYPDNTSTCEAGSQCTILSVRGYNKPCSAGGFGFGTVQREVLLQF